MPKTNRKNQRRDGVCEGKGCGKPILARRMCSGHYQRWRLTGDAQLDLPVGAIPRPPKALCSIEGCGKPVHGRGLCNTHWARLTRSGTTDDPTYLYECQVEECEAPHYAHGLCAHHCNIKFGRTRRLHFKYKMTEEEWEARFDAQGRRCAVCRLDVPGHGVWQVHHDHTCCPGERSCGRCVVAILCGRCNVGMAQLGDDPDRLERAAALMRGIRADLANEQVG